MRLEAEKRKAEDALAAERNIAVDKDALLERSKRRELELEEEVAALQGDLDTLDSQLDRALKMQKESEDKHEALRQAFDQAAEHLVHLESEQHSWAIREEELLKRLASTDRDQEELRHERGDLEQETTDLRRQLAQREEDLSRVKERMEVAISELDVKLNSEAQAQYVFVFQTSLSLSYFLDCLVNSQKVVQTPSNMTSVRPDLSWPSLLAPRPITLT